jgi:hypothetical protein
MIIEVFVGEEAIVVVDVDGEILVVIDPDHHQEDVEDDVDPGTQVVPGKDHPPPHN